jgi:MoaA/NifB/PqqE/SkfB family radical SAM enzyme
MYIVEINISNSCNLHCSYCVSGATQTFKVNKKCFATMGAVLDYQDVFLFVKKHFQPHEVRAVLISGGEPSISPQWFLLPELFAHSGYSVIILSNGALIKEFSNAFGSIHRFLLTWHMEQMPFTHFKEAVESIKDKHIVAAKTVIIPKMIREKMDFAEVESKMKSLGVPYFIHGGEKITLQSKVPYTTAFDDPVYRNRDGLNISSPEKHEQDLHVFSIRPDGSYGQCHQKLEEDMWGNIYDNEHNINPIQRQCVGENGITTICATMNTVISMMNISIPVQHDG